MQCPEELKVRYVSNLFTGDALTWWRSVRQARAGQVITWEMLEKQFNDRYMPQIYRDRKETEFLNLKQGDMSVIEYQNRIIALAKYAPMAVVTEASKCRKFEKGLHPDIRAMVHKQAIEFSELVESALRAEEIIHEKKQLYAAKRARFDTEGQSSRSTKRGGSHFSRGGSFQQSRGSSSYRGGGRSRGGFRDV